MTLTQFFDFVNAFSGERPPNQRLGQWAFNLLHEGYPEIANYIRGSEADPFHDDGRMPIFLQTVLDHVPVNPQHIAALKFIEDAPADAIQKVHVPHYALQRYTYSETAWFILAAYIVGDTLHFLSSKLKQYQIHLSSFGPAAGIEPDFSKLGLEDDGSSLFFGEWDADSTWVIMQVDEEVKAYWADERFSC